ncbi:hypothetical protein TetV_184 [Tetraselmis virus 1]|uniref:Uncharacterized protein n=1 Tax=Tetraselmis virus 1 TaxID=2060617 RepID=A0A2P0VMZ5_9VIRU|nr:hypothetical protein QJ968_gp184 [Tetraselmis virus 1]AUF82276.1 hypothetical protein TetV_184 [Tetraselmis virus 1]
MVQTMFDKLKKKAMKIFGFTIFYEAVTGLSNIFTTLLSSKEIKKITKKDQLTPVDIFKMVLSGKLNLNYNRSLATSEEEMRQINQSFFEQPDTPKDDMYFYEDSKGNLYLLDGMRRVISICMFIAGLLKVNIDEKAFPPELIEALRERQNENDQAAADDNDNDEDDEENEEENNGPISAEMYYGDIVEDILPAFPGYLNVDLADHFKYYDLNAFKKKRRKTDALPEHVQSFVQMIRNAIDIGVLDFKPQDDESLYIEEQIREIYDRIKFDVKILVNSEGGWNLRNASAFIVQLMMNRKAQNKYDLACMTNTETVMKMKEFSNEIHSFNHTFKFPSLGSAHMGLIATVYMILMETKDVMLSPDTQTFLYQLYTVEHNTEVLDQINAIIEFMTTDTKPVELNLMQLVVVMVTYCNHFEIYDTIPKPLMFSLVKSGYKKLMNIQIGDNALDEEKVNTWLKSKKAGNLTNMCANFAIMLDLE